MDNTTVPADRKQSKNARTDARADHPIAGINHKVLESTSRASKLIGTKVYRGDIVLGQIEDVLVDLERAASEVVILAVGGFLGIGRKLVAVPTGNIAVGTEGRFMTDLTESDLADAPAFDFEVVDQHVAG